MTKKIFLEKIAKMGLFHLSAIHHDFLSVSTDENDNIEETSRYFYKPFRAQGLNEIRFWKKSKRVSVSKKNLIGIEIPKSHCLV